MDQKGFLSQENEEFRAKNRQRYEAGFDHCRRLSDIGQRLLTEIATKPTVEQTLTAVGLYVRGLQSLQGSILMAERGMVTESRTLVRATLETHFYLGAERKHPMFYDLLFMDYIARTSKNAVSALAATMQHLPGEDLSEALAGAKAFKKEFEEIAQALQIRTAADKAGMLLQYDTIYRNLSTYAAHPTLASLEIHWDRDDGGHRVGVNWGNDLGTDALYRDLFREIFLVGEDFIKEMNEIAKDHQISLALQALGRSFLETTGMVKPPGGKAAPISEQP